MKPSIRCAAATFLLVMGSHPLMPAATLEHPTPGTAQPAPEYPVPARGIGAERELRVGPAVVHVLPAPSTAGPGEWNEDIQPAMFRAWVTRAPRE